ncbi:unnamed protein product [Clonostachys rosea f. rosea IK726]|uniref:Uncharacterized protein n=2 Tax=Bionectria ochroleuca TaxID=29856 RepID=A0A0B7KL64_BIOOC|nr:unnamed protein product [Clonostachys rosea f. rosea IK726]
MWANGAPLPALANQRVSLDRETPRSDLSLFGMASNEANLTDLIATPVSALDPCPRKEGRPSLAMSNIDAGHPFRAAQTR